MITILLFLFAMPQTQRGPAIINTFGTNMEEITYTEILKMPHRGKKRYLYPTDKGYISHPKCSAIDEQLPHGPGPFFEQESREGFTVKAPAGHIVTLTCKALIANGPLWERPRKSARCPLAR
jgi:hypothetical protein